VKIASVREVTLPKAVQVFEVQIAGLSCMGSAIETRDVLSKLEGVIRVHPNGMNGKALVFVKEKDVFTMEKAKEALAKTKELRLRKCAPVKNPQA
jgi:hypothetical protein